MTTPSSLPPRSDQRLDDEDLPEPRQVRRLRWMVTALTLASILAVLAIAGAIVIRLALLSPADPASSLPAPIAAERLSVPAGEAITALGRAGREILVTTRDGDGAERLRAFDAESGDPRSVTLIERR
ncbi:MAG: DUF6476 family protein [Pseudomonadota bacterium]